MSNQYNATGNVGNAPEFRKVNVGDESRSVVSFSIYIEKVRPDGNGGFERISGFWLDVTAWGRLAENVMQHVQKGTRVKVEGRLEDASWETDAGEKRKGIILVADDITLSLSRIEKVIYKSKSTKNDPDNELGEE